MIEQTPSGTTIITGRASIELFRLIVLRSKLKLELCGLKVSKGRTAYSVLKQELRLHGDRRSVLSQVERLLDTCQANASGAQRVQ